MTQMSTIQAAGTNSANTSATGAFGAMSSQDFIRVLTAELSNQDPFEPKDSSAMLEQLSSLRNIESQMSLQSQLQALVLQNQIAMAGGLIGKNVVGLDEQNNTVDGIVTSVRVQEGKAWLELDTGKTVPMDRIAKITGETGRLTDVEVEG